MPEILMNMPEPPKGYDYTGELRPPKGGEYFLPINCRGKIMAYVLRNDINAHMESRPILRKINPPVATTAKYVVYLTGGQKMLKIPSCAYGTGVEILVSSATSFVDEDGRHFMRWEDPDGHGGFYCTTVVRPGWKAVFKLDKENNDA